MEKLIKKGQKTVASYMKRAGFLLGAVYENADGNTIAEYSLMAAGVTFKHVDVVFNSNWRCIAVNVVK